MGQQRGNLGAQVGRDGCAAGQQVVTRHDGDQVAESAVDAFDVAAHRGFVDHVVVVERGEVDELDGHRAHEVVLGRVAVASRRRGQRQQGPEALSAGGGQVGGDHVEEGIARDDRIAEQGFQALQSLLHVGQAEGLGRVHCPRR